MTTPKSPATSELKNCPFCGSTPELKPFPDNKKMMAIVCNNIPCDQSGLLFAMADRGDGFSGAIEAWNTRFEPIPTDAGTTGTNKKQE